MPEAIFIQNGGQQDYTPGSAVVAGALVRLSDGRMAVAKTSLAANQKGAVYTRGIFDVLAASGTTFAAGDPVYWDASADLAITTPGAVDDIYLGTAVAAKVSGTTVVRVDLNEGIGGSGGTGQRGAFVTRMVELVYSDTAKFDLIEAAENPLGLYLHSAFGEVTEVMAGASQDQMIVSLYDSDDNALAVLTPSDGGADAVGDLIVATRTTSQGALGAVIAKVPAGKGLYAKVSQACSGAGAAGKVKVQALLATA